MPELPELENVRCILENSIVGRRIRQLNVDPRGGPIVLRDLLGDGSGQVLHGSTVLDVLRRGKFILLRLDAGSWMAVNPKLAGRFSLSPAGEKKTASTIMQVTFENWDTELRYLDDKRMGQVYLTAELETLPRYRELGDEVSSIGLEQFQARSQRFRGEIKGVLTREGLVAGIGNAYADEILWQARVHPFTKRTAMTLDELEALYRAMRTTLLEAGHLAREAMAGVPDLKPRDFFRVHMRGGQACPRCGTTISEIRAQRKVTNFCRSCQPGGLFKDMG